MRNSDNRYEHVTCASCGRRIQRIEFFGNPHISFCARPEIESLDYRNRPSPEQPCFQRDFDNGSE